LDREVAAIGRLTLSADGGAASRRVLDATSTIRHYTGRHHDPPPCVGEEGGPPHVGSTSLIFVLVAVAVGLAILALVTLLVVSVVRTSRSDQNPGGTP